MPPQESGYSITMKDASLQKYEFPEGSAWKNIIQQ